MKYKGYKDLNVYKLAYSLSMEIFEVTKKFPKEEKYSLTDQIRRSSRSITANIAEGWAKRRFENVFKRHLMDSLGSAEEVKVWLDFAQQAMYIDEQMHKRLFQEYTEIALMLDALVKRWKTYK